jgi:hypothetical protein
MADNQNLPVGAATTALAGGVDGGVGDTTQAAGMALGDLVRQVGIAAAETQRRLNATCAATSTALAETMVDIVAVRHKEFNDDGTVRETGNITMPLPLVNFVDPVNYQMERMHLQGVFYASEFRAEGGTSSGGTTSAGNANLFLGAPFGGQTLSGGLGAVSGAAAGGATNGSVSGSTASTGTQTSTSTQQDYEYGQVRMSTEMLPRTDIGVPMPIHVIRGPSLSLVPQGVTVTEVAATETTPARVAARASIVQVTYRRWPTATHPSGQPIAGASFTVEAGGLQWNYCTSTGTVDETAAATVRQTAADGTLYFVVRRAIAPGEDPTPRNFAVTARIGIVASTVPVAL